MSVDLGQLRAAALRSGGKVVCLHAALSSFGEVQGGRLVGFYWECQPGLAPPRSPDLAAAGTGQQEEGGVLGALVSRVEFCDAYPMSVDLGQLRAAALRSGGKVVCLHAALSSFGEVQGGAQTVLEAFLTHGCTLMVPTFSWDLYAVSPSDVPAELRPERNGCDARAPARRDPAHVFHPSSQSVDGAMGAIPAVVATRKGRRRGDHPLCSFTAHGPRAEWLVAGQSWDRVFDPLERLCQMGGVVVLAGVGLSRMTLLHYAEQRAGREPFRRWARRRDGTIGVVAVGGCSEGFERLGTALTSIERVEEVGASRWRVFPAREVVELAAAAIRADPWITACADPECVRCRDARLGGPVLDAGSP